MRVYAAITLVLVANTAYIGVEAWGGLFNRFSPEMLSNLGYGGHGSYMNRPGLLQEGYDGIYGEGAEPTEEPCYERKCMYNDHCCPGSICMNFNGVTGTCVSDFGMTQGELCRRDSDCETGLMCAEMSGHEECAMSSECDISRGLCCQLQRRHRQAPRKVCSYFKDPLVCIGPVATDQIKSVIQYTSGEKRITGQGNRLFKRMPFA
ncbi:Prohormone-3 [Camponotus floridanus]|uniref:ITG-like peptide n=1 Tax=Camponotus floridanus TaxID=104421 RepID=PROH3_CAMFO|nr:RecName: Full=ITG-like peptide; Flags: Precursor [Camponotus floridanus]EFN68524.1 Prohormone-3 [Camponotus floridanus]